MKIKFSKCLFRLLFACAFLLNLIEADAQPGAVIMLRHAERVVYDYSDNDLSAAGRQRAQRLAEILKDAGVTHIYISNLQRTKQTAEPLAIRLGLPMIVVPGSNEKYTLAMVKNFDSLTSKDVALVISHIDTFIPLIKAMGYTRGIQIADYEHDDLFMVFPRRNEEPIVLRLNY